LELNLVLVLFGLEKKFEIEVEKFVVAVLKKESEVKLRM
jgi:hypothetical protein